MFFGADPTDVAPNGHSGKPFHGVGGGLGEEPGIGRLGPGIGGADQSLLPPVSNTMDRDSEPDDLKAKSKKGKKGKKSKKNKKEVSRERAKPMAIGLTAAGTSANFNGDADADAQGYVPVAQVVNETDTPLQPPGQRQRQRTADSVASGDSVSGGVRRRTGSTTADAVIGSETVEGITDAAKQIFKLQLIGCGLDSFRFRAGLAFERSVGVMS